MAVTSYAVWVESRQGDINSYQGAVIERVSKDVLRVRLGVPENEAVPRETLRNLLRRHRGLVELMLPNVKTMTMQKVKVRRLLGGLCVKDVWDYGIGW